MSFKKILFFIALFVSVDTSAQKIDRELRCIDVVGSAEMEIVPDVIRFSFELKEYKQGKVEVKLPEAEAKLMEILKGLGIDPKNLALENSNGDLYTLKHRTKEFVVSKSYILTMDNIAKLDSLQEQLEGIGVESSRISSVSHSKIVQYRKELKIEAAKAAKEKAQYLLAAVGEELGQLLYLSESERTANEWQQLGISNRFHWTVGDGGASGSVNIKKINLKCEVTAKYGIK